MKEILEASQSERSQYFQEAAARSKTIKNPIIIEKDFWVCWTLDQIFSSQLLSPHTTFKGGTSLSKCYSMTDRFSEDIDLTLSKQYIGIDDENDPASVTTANQRQKRLEQLTEKVKNKITYGVKPLLIETFKNSISLYANETEWQLVADEFDEQSLIFHYPSGFEKKSDGYIQSSIKLEFGARGDISPSESKLLSPYVQQFLPELFGASPGIKVMALTAKRTYWEKITLLHAEYHRDHQKTLPKRLFRHYYDIVMLDRNKLNDDALKDVELLSDVVRNKTIYFPSKWANYDTAKIGTLRLSPNEAFVAQLKQDHESMAEMFFGEPPDFEEILEGIKRIEEVINQN